MSPSSDILPDHASLEKENPLLHSIPKKNPFSVPLNYFDSLPSEIMEKCRKEVEPKSWGIGIFINLLGHKWKLLTIATCAVLICFFTTQLKNQSVSYETLTKNISDSLILEHLDQNIADINITTLEDFQETENSYSPVKSASDSTGNDQDIIAYLMNTNVNVSDIVNEP
jgi:hypothetical protein